MTSILEGQPLHQNKAFAKQNNGHVGSRYVYLHI